MMTEWKWRNETNDIVRNGEDETERNFSNVKFWLPKKNDFENEHDDTHSHTERDESIDFEFCVQKFLGRSMSSSSLNRRRIA